MNKLVSPSFCVSIMLLLTSYTNAMGEETNETSNSSTISNSKEIPENLESGIKNPEEQVEEAQTLDSGNSAWMITATALVLFMTLPGLALFYGGLVQSKNVLSVLMQCFAIACLASILWVVCGYSLSLTPGENQWIGGSSSFFLKTLSIENLNGDFPESVWVIFQMTFAIITLV